MDPAPSAVSAAPCPDCGSEVAVPGDTTLGEVVECPECGVPLEVVAFTPLTLAPFDEEEK